MVEHSEQLQKFFDLCENSSFPYQEELLEGVRSGKYSLKNYSESGVSVESILDTYKTKSRIVGGHAGEHARRLANDMHLFIEKLRKVSADTINFWHFSVNESTNYTLFEAKNREQILGCILTIDRRKVSAAEWDKLWSE